MFSGKGRGKNWERIATEVEAAGPCRTRPLNINAPVVPVTEK